MAKDEARLSGPDLTKGIEPDALADGGKLVGYAGDEQVLLVRRGTELFAVGAHCTHYHAALVDGLVVDNTVRCPWHHACFSLRTGEALRPPALSPLPCFSVEQTEGKIFVREKLEPIVAVSCRTAVANASRKNRDHRRWRSRLCRRREIAAGAIPGKHRYVEQR